MIRSEDISGRNLTAGETNFEYMGEWAPWDQRPFTVTVEMVITA